MITRKPLSFGDTVWMGSEAVGDEIPSMLPDRIASVTAAQIMEVEELIRHNDGMTLEPV